MNYTNPLLTNIWINPEKFVIYGFSLIICILFISLMTLSFGNELIGTILLDSSSEAFPYPFTIHNLMHILFFLGAGDLYVRWRNAVREGGFLGLNFLPQNISGPYTLNDIAKLMKRVQGLHSETQGYLPGLIELSLIQFVSSKSVDQTLAVVNSSLELASKRVELNYAFSRYLVWVIPTVGFVGTVVHMSLALKGINPKSPDLGQLTASLGVSFYTTLVALIESAILVLALNLIEAKEERVVVDSGQYILKKLINKLYVHN